MALLFKYSVPLRLVVQTRITREMVDGGNLALTDLLIEIGFNLKANSSRLDGPVTPPSEELFILVEPRIAAFVDSGGGGHAIGAFAMVHRAKYDDIRGAVAKPKAYQLVIDYIHPETGYVLRHSSSVHVLELNPLG